ncbi:hypothetical protein EVAR_101322_1 [Eumeta japonica]|uniref:Secreted protein n=1 Tax=Eumeta variegata TaxID=151549 RepID=A0A4C1SY85_EUMVA|nr:hypothetical protein EVAR_101322_1 [Eumeta japonica]
MAWTIVVLRWLLMMLLLVAGGCCLFCRFSLVGYRFRVKQCVVVLAHFAGDHGVTSSQIMAPCQAIFAPPIFSTISSRFSRSWLSANPYAVMVVAELTFGKFRVSTTIASAMQFLRPVVINLRLGLTA